MAFPTATLNMEITKTQGVLDNLQEISNFLDRIDMFREYADSGWVRANNPICEFRFKNEQDEWRTITIPKSVRERFRAFFILWLNAAGYTTLSENAGIVPETASRQLLDEFHKQFGTRIEDFISTGTLSE